MAGIDFRGARGSNAGDDFHELWALRQALELLDAGSALSAITVEGVAPETEATTTADAWDGVDCALYYGPIASAGRIVIEQLKYSSADPDKDWTVARLVSASNKRKDNSVISRLGKAFAALCNVRPDLAATGSIVVRLVSNQPIGSAVMAALAPLATEMSADGHQIDDRTALFRASGLTAEEFERFTAALDLSECGTNSRFGLEEQILRQLSEWTDDDARTALNDLMRFIRLAMMPESKGQILDRQSILARLGYSDPRGLLPCPAAFTPVADLVSRSVTREIVEKFQAGVQRVCLHGEGGTGKTTVLQELAQRLPAGSVMLTFDCYGGGRYLNANETRHRPREAFLQLSNELASKVRIPFLATSNSNSNYAASFHRRLLKAAEVVATSGPEALLVVAIDAADNSLTAAESDPPTKVSFVSEFMRLGDLPLSVRLLLTTRTGSLSLFSLREWSVHPLPGFSLGETKEYARRTWPSAPEQWVDDFHHLSRGNPRVQSYALRYAESEPQRAIDYLRPNGKGLNDVFHTQLAHAFLKHGKESDIRSFCAGLVSLPRPIPIEALADVTGLSSGTIRDLCADLAPGTRLEPPNAIGLADEDFEHFVRQEAGPSLSGLSGRIADYFLSRHGADSYAAAYLAEALFRAGRGKEILELVQHENAPEAIQDPALRRETQLRRLRIAMRVARTSGNDADALLTLLVGAESLKTNDAVLAALVENPDLAAAMAKDSVGRLILRDPDQIEHHGPLLFHLMCAASQAGDAIGFREHYRQVNAWLQRRDAQGELERRKHPNTERRLWKITKRDIAAETEAVLRVSGARTAVAGLRRWRPRRNALEVGMLLAPRLVISGDADLLERCLNEGGVKSPWALFIGLPLFLAGLRSDTEILTRCAQQLLRRRLIRVDKLLGSFDEDRRDSRYFDAILMACEIVIALGGDRSKIIPILAQFAGPELRQRGRLNTHTRNALDATLRAASLLRRLEGQALDLDAYLLEAPPKEGSDKERDHWEADRRRELREFVDTFMPVYNVRARILTGDVEPTQAVHALEQALSKLRAGEYRYSRDHSRWEMLSKVAESLACLIAIKGIDRASLLSTIQGLLKGKYGQSVAMNSRVLSCFALDRGLHVQIAGLITAEASRVRGLKTAAREKRDRLIRLARLLTPISRSDAESLFNEAIQSSSELDDEAIHQLALFDQFSRRATAILASEERRAIAMDIAIATADAAIRLSDYERFSWEEISAALTTLDVNVALAAMSRWEDEGLTSRANLLEAILCTALERATISPTQAAALMHLLENASEKLFNAVVRAAHGLDQSKRAMLAEELAKDELLRLWPGNRSKVQSQIGSLLGADQTTPSYERLTECVAFLEAPRSPRYTRLPDPSVSHEFERSGKRGTWVSAVDWTASRYQSAADISEVVGKAYAAAKAEQDFASTADVLRRIGESVRYSDRKDYLDTLCEWARLEASSDVGPALLDCIEAWSDSPSITEWCNNHLLGALSEFLPVMSRWLGQSESSLPGLLAKVSGTDKRKSDALIEGMERHAESLRSSQLFALVGLTAQFCDPTVVGQLMTKFANRLRNRVPIGDRDVWASADISFLAYESIARVIYAYMSDLDVRLRWRAAHAYRRLARLGETSTVASIVAEIGRMEERSFRAPAAPFYWLAARLWLLIAMDRVAHENPAAISDFGPMLVDAASDEDLPHLLMRAFARSAALALHDAGHLKLDRKSRAQLARCLRSPFPRKRGSTTPSRSSPFDPGERRFDFDSMDTVPYWYQSAIRRFADVDQKTFLDTAERWIADRWKVPGGTWVSDGQPRISRLTDHSWNLTSHRHGSLPILERFHTHVEWHAMWVTIGELMQTRALVALGDDPYDSLENLLAESGLTAPPLWLSDLRGPAPLEERLWFAPAQVPEWLDQIQEADFLSELGLAPKAGPTFLVAGHREVRSRAFYGETRVVSALVSRPTATSLLRALHSADSTWSFCIPPAGHDLEIRHDQYRLVGWLWDRRSDSELDGHDPLRMGVRDIESRPSAETIKTLSVKFVFDGTAKWVKRGLNYPSLTYETWSNIEQDDDDRARYDERIRSSGYRLRIHAGALKTLLKDRGLDLIVSVETTRRDRGYENHYRYENEKAKEKKTWRLYILRGDGRIEGLEGRIGTWAPSDQGTRR